MDKNTEEQMVPAKNYEEPVEQDVKEDTPTEFLHSDQPVAPAEDKDTKEDAADGEAAVHKTKETSEDTAAETPKDEDGEKCQAKDGEPSNGNVNSGDNMRAKPSTSRQRSRTSSEDQEIITMLALTPDGTPFAGQGGTGGSGLPLSEATTSIVDFIKSVIETQNDSDLETGNCCDPGASPLLSDFIQQVAGGNVSLPYLVSTLAQVQRSLKHYYENTPRQLLLQDENGVLVDGLGMCIKCSWRFSNYVLMLAAAKLAETQQDAQGGIATPEACPPEVFSLLGDCIGEQVAIGLRLTYLGEDDDDDDESGSSHSEDSQEAQNQAESDSEAEGNNNSDDDESLGLANLILTHLSELANQFLTEE